MTIGEYIHDRRKELGLTLDEIGTAVGVSKSTVRKWETGFISNMKRDKIALLAKALKVSPSVFIVQSSEEIQDKAKSPSQLSDRDKAFVELIKSLTDDERAKIADYIKYIISQRK